jgi:hypothetical protein
LVEGRRPMHRSKILALTVLFIGSSSICSATQCPHNADVTSKIEELAMDGKATFGDATYHLISKPETGIYYSGKLLENDAQLNGFLQVTQLLEPKLTNKAQAKLLPLLPPPNFCAYKISLGENAHVIALSSAS